MRMRTVKQSRCEADGDADRRREKDEAELRWWAPRHRPSAIASGRRGLGSAAQRSTI
jgi:hypothetical protein